MIESTGGTRPSPVPFGKTGSHAMQGLAGRLPLRGTPRP